MKSFLRLCVWIVVMLALWQAYGQVVTNDGMIYNLHDPSLDAINNNLGYLDADLNGQMNNLPERISKTNYFNATNEFKADARDRFLGFYNSIPGGMPALGPSNSVAISIDGKGGTNSSALKTLLGGVFTHYGSSLSNAFSTNIAADGVHYSSNNNDHITIPNTLGQSWSMDMSFTSGGYLNASYASLVRGLIIAAEFVLIFLLFLENLKELVNETMAQRQVQGSTESILGNNASAVVGIGYAVVVTAALAGAVVVIFALGFSSMVSSLGSLPAFSNSVFSFISSSPAWGVISAYVPFWQILGAWAAYYLFRYVGLIPTFYVVRAVIFWLPA